ncbi:hypothetical protein [Lysobacter gummosus]|uniref:hypothetical protein n=1 Tax=Lysobacter gummosus TaxID=262324 RepID=UPI003636CCFB
MKISIATHGGEQSFVHRRTVVRVGLGRNRERRIRQEPPDAITRGYWRSCRIRIQPQPSRTAAQSEK